MWPLRIKQVDDCWFPRYQLSKQEADYLLETVEESLMLQSRDVAPSNGQATNPIFIILIFILYRYFTFLCYDLQF